MKTNKNLVALLFAVAMIHPVIFKAQTPVYKTAAIDHPVAHWEPVALTEKGSNVQNGVEFYSHAAECSLEKVDLVKLVNKNNYSVKIAYQMGAENPVQYVRIPAASTIEGSCSATEGNLAKLTVRFPKGKSEEEIKKIKQFLISSIVVSEIK